MRNETETNSIKEFVENKVALLGALQLIEDNADDEKGLNKHSKELVDMALSNACSLNITFDDDDMTDWGHGYWMGVLKTLNWVLGDDNDLLHIT